MRWVSVEIWFVRAWGGFALRISQRLAQRSRPEPTQICLERGSVIGRREREKADLQKQTSARSDGGMEGHCTANVQ